MIVPEVDVDAVTLRGVGTPQLAHCEAHAIAMLWLLTKPHAIHIGENEHTMVAIDNTVLAARIARQPRVTGRVDVAGQYPIGRLEAWRLALDATRAAAFEQDTSDLARAQWDESLGRLVL